MYINSGNLREVGTLMLPVKIQGRDGGEYIEYTDAGEIYFQVLSRSSQLSIIQGDLLRATASDKLIVHFDPRIVVGVQLHYELAYSAPRVVNRYTVVGIHDQNNEHRMLTLDVQVLTEGE